MIGPISPCMRNALVAKGLPRVCRFSRPGYRRKLPWSIASIRRAWRPTRPAIKQTNKCRQSMQEANKCSPRKRNGLNIAPRYFLPSTYTSKTLFVCVYVCTHRRFIDCHLSLALGRSNKRWWAIHWTDRRAPVLESPERQYTSSPHWRKSPLNRHWATHTHITRNNGTHTHRV